MKQRALLMKGALLVRPNAVVTSVPLPLTVALRYRPSTVTATWKSPVLSARYCSFTPR